MRIYSITGCSRIAAKIFCAPPLSERSFEELRRVGAGSVFTMGEEGRGVPLHQAVPCGLFGVVVFAVDQSAIRLPLGLPVNDLHERLQQLCARTASSRARRLNHPVSFLPVCALRSGPPPGDCVRVSPAASGRRDEDSECLFWVIAVARLGPRSGLQVPRQVAPP